MSSDKEAKTVIEKVKKSFPLSVKSRLVSLKSSSSKAIKEIQGITQRIHLVNIKKLEKIIDSTSTRTVQLIEGCQTP